MNGKRLTVAEAERLASEWGTTYAQRDKVVRAVKAAGLNKSRIHELTGIARTTIDRILEGTPMLTEIFAVAARGASRATVAEAFRAAAAEQNIAVGIIGKIADETPVVEYEGVQYGIVQNDRDVWAALLKCSVCGTEPGQVVGDEWPHFRLDRIDSESGEAEFMCGTCWARYGTED